MPQVPVYGGPQVQARPIGAPQQSQFDVSSGIQAVAQGVQNVGRAAEVIDEKQATLDAQIADTDISAGWATWEAENRGKFQGQNAKDYPAAAKAWWDENAQKYGTSLSRTAKQKVGPTLYAKQARALAAATGYAVSEEEKFADNTAQANIETNVQLAITNGGGEAERNQIIGTISSVAARKGWDADQTKAAQLKALSGMHLGIIQKKLNEPNGAAAAQDYYTANKAEFDGARQARVEELLKAELVNERALDRSVKNAELPFEQQMADADKIKDPAEKKAYITHVMENAGRKRVAQQEREQGAADSAWQLVGQGKRVPELLLGNMDGRQRVQLQDYIKDRAEHLATAGNKPVKTDPTVHRGLWAMIADDKTKFAEVDLRPLGMKLSAEDYEQLSRLQSDIRTGKGEKDTITWQNKTKAYVEQLGLGGKAGEQKRGAFTLAAQQLYESHKARTGKAPNETEENTLLQSLSIQGETSWFGDEPKTYAEAIAKGVPIKLKDPQVDYAKLPIGAKYINPTTGVVQVKAAPKPEAKF